MLSPSKQFDKFLNSFPAGRKYLTWKASSELKALEQRYAAVSYELANLGSEISRRRGFLKDASRSNTQVR